MQCGVSVSDCFAGILTSQGLLSCKDLLIERFSTKICFLHLLFSASTQIAWRYCIYLFHISESVCALGFSISHLQDSERECVVTFKSRLCHLVMDMLIC